MPARPFTSSTTGALTLKLLAALLLAASAAIVARAQEPSKTSDTAVEQSATAVGQQSDARTAASAPYSDRSSAAVSPLTYGSITGRVVSDDGRPLSNVNVFLHAVGSSVPSGPKIGTTDNNGRFEFKNLASASYTIQMSVPGYVRVSDVDEESERSERTERTYYRLGDNINLTMTKGGVITGTVTDAAGHGVVAKRVRALRVRDASGKPQRTGSFFRETQTDDRGVYRLWGLEPGSYVVSVGNNSRFNDFMIPFNEDAPTYYPSATRDGATEVPVRYGDEHSSIDIRYRSERGRRVSGTLSGATESNTAFSDLNVSLIHTASGLVDDMDYVRSGAGNSFAFNGVSDGEYDLIARRGFGPNSAASPPLRIKVKGADITGLQLVLSPLGTITGRVVMEAAAAAPPPSCEEKTEGRQAARQRALEEAVVLLRLADTQSERPRPTLPTSLESQPKSDGEFVFGGLQPGRYRLDARLPDERWYVHSITTPGRSAPSKTTRAATAARAPKSSDAAAPPAPAQRAASTGGSPATDGAVSIGQGTQQATGIRITLASGAAKLSGRVLPSVEGSTLPPRLRLYLVPREAERADDYLRFGDTSVRSDGTFTLANLAPGRYWLLARPAPDTEANDLPALPLAWNAESRADLRRRAEAAQQEIELQPCAQLTNTTVRYAPPASPGK
jgi:Carboxypeptidase regulatory-like domain